MIGLFCKFNYILQLIFRWYIVHAAAAKGLAGKSGTIYLPPATYEGEGVKKIPKMQITSQISEMKSMCNNFFLHPTQ